MPAHPRYAVHAYAWTSSWSNDRLDILDHAKSFGLDAVEIPLMEIELVDPAAIRERAEAVGIGVCTSVAMPLDADPTGDEESSRESAVAFLRRCSELTAAMGADLLGGVTYAAHGRMLDERPTRVHMERSAEVLRQAARDAAELGVTIAIEPCNRYEVFLVNTAAQAVELADMIDEDNVGIHLDTYHMNIEEQDFETPVELVGDRLVHFHLSESHRGVPGRGVVDWAAVMRALNAIDYHGLVGLEAFQDMSPAMRAATRSWRDLAPSSDELVREGSPTCRACSARPRWRPDGPRARGATALVTGLDGRHRPRDRGVARARGRAGDRQRAHEAPVGRAIAGDRRAASRSSPTTARRRGPRRRSRVPGASTSWSTTSASTRRSPVLRRDRRAPGGGRFEVNVLSGVRLARHYLREMLERGRGRVLFIASEAAVAPPPDGRRQRAARRCSSRSRAASPS